MSENINELKSDSYIRRDATGIIKGVALVFMFIHHFFTLPEYYTVDTPFPFSEKFAEIFKEPFKICVPVFAFLTGVFYVYVKKKNLRYSLKKASDLWLKYLFFFLLMLIPAIALKCWDFSAKALLLELTCLGNSIVTFNWYVIFYIIAILLMPLYHLLAKRHLLLAVITGIMIPIALDAVVESFTISQPELYKVATNCLNWFPCIASGYIFAEHRVFERMFDPLFKNNIKPKALRGLIYFSVMAVAFMGRYFAPGVNFNVSVLTVDIPFDYLYAPLFVYGLVNIIYGFPWKKLWIPIGVIGKYSLGLWLVHRVFFNSCREYTLPILLLPKNPVLVLLWGLAICFAVTFVMMILIRPLLRLKNKWLFPEKP